MWSEACAACGVRGGAASTGVCVCVYLRVFVCASLCVHVCVCVSVCAMVGGMMLLGGEGLDNSFIDLHRRELCFETELYEKGSKQSLQCHCKKYILLY